MPISVVSNDQLTNFDDVDLTKMSLDQLEECRKDITNLLNAAKEEGIPENILEIATENVRRHLTCIDEEVRRRTSN